MSELKKCPFCGGKAIMVDIGENFYATCGEHICANNVFDNEHDAITMWNSRSEEKRLQKLIDELEAIVARQAARVVELEGALRRIIDCDVITDNGDYSMGETGFDCKEVKEIVEKALEAAK